MCIPDMVSVVEHVGRFHRWPPGSTLVGSITHTHVQHSACARLLSSSPSAPTSHSHGGASQHDRLGPGRSLPARPARTQDGVQGSNPICEESACATTTKLRDSTHGELIEASSAEDCPLAGDSRKQLYHISEWREAEHSTKREPPHPRS